MFDTAALYPGRISRTRPTCSSATTPATARRGIARPASSPGRSSRTTSKPGAATTASIRGSCPACSSATARIDTDDPALDRHRADRAAPVRHRAAGVHGRQAAGRGGSHESSTRWRALARPASSLVLAVAVRQRQQARRRARHRPRLRRPRLRAHARPDGARAGCRISRGSPQAGRSRRSARPMPPQSPVAWSTFITGLDPGRHGIFDFIHRDPKTMVPFLSTTKTAEGGRTLTLGKWQFPLSGGTRRAAAAAAQPFWEVLERPRRRDDDHPHAGQLSAVGHGDARAERHGHAGHSRHLRHVLVLHVGAVRLRRPAAVRRHGRIRSTS